MHKIKLICFLYIYICSMMLTLSPIFQINWTYSPYQAFDKTRSTKKCIREMDGHFLHHTWLYILNFQGIRKLVCIFLVRGDSKFFCDFQGCSNMENFGPNLLSSLEMAMDAKPWILFCDTNMSYGNQAKTSFFFVCGKKEGELYSIYWCENPVLYL